MNEIIIVKPEKCVGCTACIRSCPAPEANITHKLEDGRCITSVDPEKCIACGACIEACTHGARDFIDDTEDAMAAIAHGEKLIILVAPEIKASYPNKWKGILDWFRSKGCILYDVSFGADICTWAHVRGLESGQINKIITQTCPAVVKYIELYQPKLLTNLSPFHSPVACSAIYLKEYQRRDNPVAILSACIAKKNEFTETNLVDYNITFRRLMEYFDRSDIRIATNPADNYEYKFDDMQGSLGSLFSMPGGMRTNLWEHDPDLSIVAADGVRTVYRDLEMYAKTPEQKLPQILEVMSCECGCNLGPACGNELSAFEVSDVMREIEQEARDRRKTSGGMFRNTEDKMFRRFDEELRFADFIRSYKPAKPSVSPSESQLDPIFASMGKNTDADKKFDCGACGYKSCREMAIAIYRGLNHADNCLVHAKQLLNSGEGGGESNEKYHKLSGECIQVASQLDQAVSEIEASMQSIDASASATGERVGVVNDLLRNIVAFCNANPVMDEGSVTQLTSILETTISALGAFNENVTETNKSTGEIGVSLSNIKKQLEELNHSLSGTNA